MSPGGHQGLQKAGLVPTRGCVPILLTMPILFTFLLDARLFNQAARRTLRPLDHRPVSLRSVLRRADSDRHHDAGAAAGHAAASADPVQQKVYMLMPVIFTGGYSCGRRAA